MAARLRGEAEAPAVAAARESLLAFARLLKPDYEPDWFHEALAAELEAFWRGAVARLLVCLPPQHGKTELVSRLAPAWALGRWPDLRVIAGSYNDDAASRVNLDVQRYIDSEAYALAFPATRLAAPGQARAARHRRERRTARFFEVVGRRGYYRSAGRGTGITGTPADVALIDDPIKDREEAESATVRQAVWDWYTAQVLTRLRKDGRQLVVMTRWHEDDLVGRLLASGRASGQEWRVVRFPAVAETLASAAVARHPELARHPADRRADGEALWPRHFPPATLAERRVVLGAYQFDGMFQQRPTAPGGTEFAREHAQFLDATPAVPGVQRCRGWDCGATEAGGDWTVGARLARVPPCEALPRGGYVVEDVVRGQWGPATVDEVVLTTAEADGPLCLQREEQEPGASGKAVVVARAARMRERGRSYEAVPAASAKSVRRLPLRALWEARRVWLLRAPWNAALLDELADLPGGAHDDIGDALATATNTLAALPVGVGGAEPLAGHGPPPSAGRPAPTDRVACGLCGHTFAYQTMSRVNGGVYCPSCETRAAAAHGAPA